MPSWLLRSDGPGPISIFSPGEEHWNWWKPVLREGEALLWTGRPGVLSTFSVLRYGYAVTSQRALKRIGENGSSFEEIEFDATTRTELHGDTREHIYIKNNGESRLRDFAAGTALGFLVQSRLWFYHLPQATSVAELIDAAAIENRHAP